MTILAAILAILIFIAFVCWAVGPLNSDELGDPYAHYSAPLEMAHEVYEYEEAEFG